MRRVAVIGAGQMGSGIAEVFAIAGYSVKVYDLNEEIFVRSESRILDSLKKLEAKCIIDKKAEAILKKISYHKELIELKGTPLFIESVFEDFETKTNILYQLADILTPNAFVASNTSSYSITSLSRLLPYPERFAGFHFMNPPPVMDLIEVIRGLYTSEDTFRFFWQLAKDLKKIPIESKNAPGFVLNRILMPMINEAIYALYEGVSTPAQIDAALKLGANHPIGPLALADLIGLDTVLAILKTLQKELGENKYAPCPLLENYVINKRLGKKTLKGFYDYSK